MKRYESLATDTVNAVEEITRQGKCTGDYIALHEPDFEDSNAIKYVNECINTGWVSTAGKWVDKFETCISEYTNIRSAVAVTNGTNGIRLALHAIGVQENDEVLLPSLTFVATGNAVSHLKAIPNFVDVEQESLGVCPKKLIDYLERIAIKKNGRAYNKFTGRQISALIIVHIFGRVAKVKKIVEISQSWGIEVIEDAAEALGSWSNAIHCGGYGRCGILSFNGNKILTTGGGGIIVSNDVDLMELCKHMSTTAKLKHPWEYDHDMIAWNDRMPNINAALGVSQLEKLPEKLTLKKKLHQKYEFIFDNIEGIKILNDEMGTQSNNWLITGMITAPEVDESRLIRDQILHMALGKGLGLRPLWKPLHQLGIYKFAEKDNLKTTEELYNRIINFPSSAQLMKNQR